MDETPKHARSPVRDRVEHLKSGGRPTVLDLFAGCGGLSLGFHAAGFNIKGALETDPDAIASHAKNFHSPTSSISPYMLPRDIRDTEPEDIIRDFNLTYSTSPIDVIIGGPPCQAFARVGRAKLREVLEHPEAFLRDPRSNLYLRYLHYVAVFRPLVLVMENVPDVLNYGGHNVAEEICESLSEIGYTCKYTLLNSAYYGVPQMRERMFLVASLDELRLEIDFPLPTNWLDLPRGYGSSRQVALRGMRGSLFNGFYTKPPEADANLPPAVTAEQALRDLPEITEHLKGGLVRGARRFDQLAKYRSGVRPSKYAELMRNWPGFKSNGGIFDHVIRSLPRDYAIFRRMNAGDQYPQAYQHAMALLEETVHDLGTTIEVTDEAYGLLKKKFVPPYDPSKFPNKWRKMEPDKPARTLMAHLGKDGYSHIHYDSNQARTISVREAARLQSFPDGFLFSGTMNPAFRQIGNAVPPLVSRAIATQIMEQLIKLK